MITPDSTLLEIGCGTGDLLFRAAPKLSHGHGIDLDEDMVKFAESKRHVNNIENLSFSCCDALNIKPKRYDVSTSTLCLHEMEVTKACRLLNFLVKNSQQVFIADYTSATSLAAKLGIEVDELFSGHYRYYRRYKQFGEIPAYTNKVGAKVQKVLKTKIDGIAIWVITS